MCGINYDNFNARNEQALRGLSHYGDKIWKNRVNGEHMLEGLIEWTEKYEEVCDSIYIYGF